MREILAQSLGPGITLFVVIAMFNLGLDLTTRQITEPLRNRRLQVSPLVANFILVLMVLSLGLFGIHVEQGKVLLKLLVVAALPMTLGLVIRARFEAVAAGLSKVVHRIAMVFLCLLLAQISFVHFDKFATLQGNVLIVGLLFVAAALAAGYLMGGPEKRNHRALAIMTLVRGGGGSIAMMVAGQALSRDEGVLVMTTVMTSASVVFCVLASAMLRRIPV